MKTAISIPDKIFESAEKLAHRLGKSRSQLYTQALHSYLEKNDDQLVQEALDNLYEHTPSSIEPALQTLQTKSLLKEQW